MIQTTPIRATAAAVAPSSANEDESLISKFGMYPFVGLATTALVSKEVLILSEETLVAVNFAGFCLAAYIATGSKLHDAFEAERQENIARIQAATDFRVKLIAAEMDQWNATKNTADAVKGVVAQNADADKDYVVAVARKKKQDAVLKAQTALDAIVKAEAFERAEAQGALVVDAANYVRAAFVKASKEQKQLALKDAIDNIGDGSKQSPMDKDPVKQLFMEYIKNQK